MSPAPARVLHVLAQRPSRTGSGITLDALVREAQARGFDQAVLVGTPVDDPRPAVGGLPSERIHALTFDAGERFGEVPFPVPGMSDVMPYASSVWSELTEDELARYRGAWRARLAAVVRGYAPDLIHVHHAWLVAALVKDVAPDVPVVMHAHGTGLVQLARCPGLADEVRRGCARNERLCVLHDDHARRYAAELAYDAARIRVVGAGFREELFHARGRRAEKDTLLFAGKLSRAKGVPWLLDAFEELRARRPTARLELAGGGSGAESDALRARVAATPGCVALGELLPERLGERMRGAAAFVLPSLAEGLPLVLCEAAACGCRLVASDLPGTRVLQRTLGERLELVGCPPPLASPVHGTPRFVRSLCDALERALERGEPTDEVALGEFRWAAVLVRVVSVWRELAASSGSDR